MIDFFSCGQKPSRFLNVRYIGLKVRCFRYFTKNSPRKQLICAITWIINAIRFHVSGVIFVVQFNSDSSVMVKSVIQTPAKNSAFEFSVSRLSETEAGTNNRKTKGKWNSFIYVGGGNGVLEIDFDEHIAIGGKVFYLEKFKYWEWIKVNGMEGIMVQFTDSFYNYIYTGNPKIKSDQTLMGAFAPFIKVEENNRNVWENIVGVILSEYSSLTTNSKEILCLCLKIMILMYRRNKYSRSNMIIADRKKQLLNEFRKLVNNRFAELKTPKGFARELNITPNYLNALCKEVYNQTISDIIRERIILEAKRYLAHTGLSVSEIAYRIGFRDNSYFGRYFKKAVGMPPERFRLIAYSSRNV